MFFFFLFLFFYQTSWRVSRVLDCYPSLMVRLMLVNMHVRDIQQQTRSYTCSKLFTKQLMVAMQELEFFFAGFSKGFDLIDHNILMDELKQVEVCPALLS